MSDQEIEVEMEQCFGAENPDLMAIRKKVGRFEE